MVKTLLYVILLFIVGVGCNAPVTPTSYNRFSDSKLERIYEFQDKQATRQLIPLLRSKKPIHREAAVLAFASIQDTFAVRFLRERMLTDSDPNVRKAAAYSIGQMRDSANVGMLFMALENEISSDSRKYILESLGKSVNADVLNYFNTFTTSVTQLREGHARGMYRAMYQKQVGDSFAKQCLRYFDYVSSDEAKYYAASTLSKLPKAMVAAHIDTIKVIHSRESDLEVKRLLMTIIYPMEAVVVSIPWNEFIVNSKAYTDKPYELVNDLRNVDLNSIEAAETLKDWTFNHRYQIVRTTSCELFFKWLNTGWDKKNGPTYNTFIEDCIASRDMALQSLACYEIVKNPSEKWKVLLEDYQDSLAIPSQMETFIDIGKAIAAIDSVKYVKPTVAYNHPIDWDYVKRIPSGQQVEIVTSQGNITIALNVDDAPGSVSNFLKKVDEGYYSDKFFHRVVSNFVIQAGCYRGDGWGSPDWTQRSEFSNYLSYTTGAVGLASSGKDTEGVQIFITHNPTPFLDGRYSIFGYVIVGMDVVNAIDVGDKIIEIHRRTSDQ
ncbi:MAG: cyclophilin family peptidyl-prolyl cis-trans isomerase [Bacteroidia bacterium]|jgi:cyclophilin family peptidyl-prolyl cis-trans isomerase